ncbi:MAG: tripartite tricarboxylate transporter TctB family protein [Desulfobacterales bacterium]|nr:tripartite tricarboxylate transporter TctB family protein [Desulfobacterales bacterium]
MKYMLNIKNGIAVLFLAAGAYLLNETYVEREIFYFSADELGPMTYPRYLLWAWMGLSALYLILPREPADLSNIKASLPLLAGGTLAIIIYIVLFKTLGLPISTFLFLMIFFYILRYRNPLKMVGLSITCAVAVWVIFEKLLGVPMPGGILTGLLG